jgi:hypothetical protein
MSGNRCARFTTVLAGTASVTDETDVTLKTYNSHTCARARHSTNLFSGYIGFIGYGLPSGGIAA